MTREQKQRLAIAMIQQVADLFENWDERIEHGGLDEELSEVDPVEAKQQVANWLSKLPGQGWDSRLPQPTN